ncbi:cadmium resistance transporter [Alkalinema sp. FACHB-956]|uniref:cadmium resistance transporter n=1 Tax=Alkalinema sp. FACHB-956 TaxID=2692768 RepID=UPI001F54F9A4|nr:cadmium resistance transporter [Alkalinema sp. FACHB-956]
MSSTMSSIWITQAITTGITAFVATNFDDLVILTIFFSQVDGKFRIRHIVLGQFLGFLVLILASLPGFFGGVFLPRPWLGLLGLLPIAIGINHLLQSNGSEPTVQQVNLSPARPANNRNYFTAFLSPYTYQVAAITIANGGDNIGIYVPLFANSNLPSLSIILISFFVLIGVWCALSYYLTQHRLIVNTLTRYGHRIVPFVLISLGLFILVESKTYTLLVK